MKYQQFYTSKWLICVFVIFWMTATASTQKIVFSGHVKKSVTKEVLPGASIYLADEKIGTVADKNGYFKFEGIPKGHHIVEITHTGFETLLEHIELSDSNSIIREFFLTPSIIENSAVIVTGVTSSGSAKRSTVPVNVIKRTNLLELTSTNIIDALSKVPGISQISTGPAISKPVIRGLSSNRVVVVSDGVRQEGQQWGDEHGIELDENTVERIEIIKGPASVLYGSDALAGVLNVITYAPVQEGKIKGHFNSSYQSNSGLIASSIEIGGTKKGFNWGVNASGKSAGDYSNKYDGKVFNSRFNEKDYAASIGLNKDWGYTHLMASHFGQEIGMVEGERDDNTGEFLVYPGTGNEHVATASELRARNMLTPYQHIEHQKYVSDNSFVLGRHRLKLNLSYQKNDRKEFADPSVPKVPGLDFSLGTFQYNAQWKFPPMNEWHVIAGLSGMNQRSDNYGEEVLIPAYHLFDQGLFVYMQKFQDKFSWSGGLRFDSRNLQSKAFTQNGLARFSAFDKSFQNWSGSIGCNYALSNVVTYKINMARGFRAPSIAELGSNGVHEGTGRYEYGSSNLRSEVSWQMDGGLELKYDHLTLSVAAFQNNINHFVFYRKLLNNTGTDSMVLNDGKYYPAFVFNQRSASLSGLELTIDLHPHPIDWLHIENSFSMVRGKFDEQVELSRNMPLVPAPHWLLEIRMEGAGQGKTLKGPYAKLEVDNNFKQANYFFDYGTETATKGYTLLNLSGGGSLHNRKGDKILSFTLALNNISNVAWQNHLSRLKYAPVNLQTSRVGVFGVGRNFSMKIDFPFEFKK